MAETLPFPCSKRWTCAPSDPATSAVPSLLPSSRTRIRSGGRSRVRSEIVFGSTAAPLWLGITAVTRVGSELNSRSGLRPNNSITILRKSTSAQKSATKMKV